MVDRPWERESGESDTAWSAFLKYRDLGPGRTFDAAGLLIYRTQSGRNRGATGQVREWADRWRWADRARAWDDHLQSERDRVASEVAAEEAAKWEARRQAALEHVWRDAQALRAKAARMLNYPLKRRRAESDDQTTIYEPARWSMRDAATLLKAAAEMESAALRAATKDPASQDDVELGGTASEPGAGGVTPASGDGSGRPVA